MPILIERNARDGKPVFAIEFKKAGRPYRTMWTQQKPEAEAWLKNIAQSDWCVSARPMPLI